MITVTLKQNEYLLRLEEKPMTTRDLMLDRMVSMGSAGKMVKRLRDAGLIKTEGWQHRLMKPYSELNIKIENRNKRTKVQDEEVLYAAILRNAGLTGQRLSGQYRKIFPKRGRGAIKNIVGKARKQGLCR